MTRQAGLLRVLATCALIAITTAGLAAAPASEFLDTRVELKPDPSRPGALMWEKPGLDRAKYTKVMFEPLTIFIAPDSEYKGLDADAINALAAGFREAVVRTLEPELPVVSVAGDGVLYVRAAVTRVKLKKPARGLLSYTPIGIVVTAAQDAAGKRISLQDAVLEIEARDAVSGETLAILVDRRPMTQTGGNPELSWKSIEETFKFYATRFKSRMLAAQAESK